jgi:hypothetical protein
VLRTKRQLSAAQPCPRYTKSRPLEGKVKEGIHIDVEAYTHCGGSVKLIADTSDRCIEDQQVIDKILFHLKKKDGLPSPDVLPETRAPPHQQ